MLILTYEDKLSITYSQCLLQVNNDNNNNNNNNNSNNNNNNMALMMMMMMIITLLDNTITVKTSSFHRGLTIFQTTIITNLNG